MGEYDRVLELHKKKSKAEKSKLHSEISRKLARLKKRPRAATASLGNVEASRMTARQATQAVANYFWNYNSVEATLLACAVFINLSGIMFDAFESCGRDTGGYYAPQRTLLTYITLLLIVCSLVYFGIVLGSEVWVALNADGSITTFFRKYVFCCVCPTVPEHLRVSAEKRKSKKNGTEEGIEMASVNGSLSVNPLFSSPSSAGSGGPIGADDVMDLPELPPAQIDWIKYRRYFESLREGYEELQTTNKSLRREMRMSKLRQQRSALEDTGPHRSESTSPSRRKRRKRRSVEFGGAVAGENGKDSARERKLAALASKKASAQKRLAAKRKL